MEFTVVLDLQNPVLWAIGILVGLFLYFTIVVFVMRWLTSWIAKAYDNNCSPAELGVAASYIWPISVPLILICYILYRFGKFIWKLGYRGNDDDKTYYHY